MPSGEESATFWTSTELLVLEGRNQVPDSRGAAEEEIDWFLCLDPAVSYLDHPSERPNVLKSGSSWVFLRREWQNSARHMNLAR